MLRVQLFGVLFEGWYRRQWKEMAGPSTITK